MALEKELETYMRELPHLLDQEGKFVLIQNDNVLDILGTYEDTIQRGYERFGVDTPFLVKRIQSFQDVQFVTRDLIFPCRT